VAGIRGATAGGVAVARVAATRGAVGGDAGVAGVAVGFAGAGCVAATGGCAAAGTGATLAQPAVSSKIKTAVYLANQSHPINRRTDRTSTS